MVFLTSICLLQGQESAAANSSENEALISDTESTGDTEEQKINEKVQAINLNATPEDSEYSEEEEKKAEAFKVAGNEFFKGKLTILQLIWLKQHAWPNSVFYFFLLAKKFQEAAE